nr:non-ribosomal peptide synthetase [Chondromyces crocatus]
MQAAQWPEATAVTFESRSLSYRELDERSNQLAHYLQRMGIIRGTLVLICLDRSTDIIVAILGVLKAGGAYVPIDAAQSDERVAFYLSDSRAPLVISSRSLGRTWAEPVRAVLVDEDAQAIAGEPTTPPTVAGSDEDLAYVIYTSGSTGVPKGVMITHHNVVRFVEGTEEHFAIDHRDVFALFHSYAWDASVWMTWGALLRGAELVMVSLEDCRALHRFAKVLRERQVTTVLLTPSVFRQLMPILLAEPVGYALRYVAIGGEMLNFASLRPWFVQMGDQKPNIINAYGPTEITIASSFRRVTREDAEVDLGSFIGKPVADTQYLVLDEHLQTVPEGEEGELFISGAGLGRGYLHRPGLTAERYLTGLPDGGRMYRTGDRVRRTPEGDTEYLGRVDSQVKIRGHRVEPGEIVAHLEGEPGVAAATVVAFGEPHAKRLVAYVVLHPEHTMTARGLQRSLARRLPDYMVPSVIMFLERLPLQINDKVDPRALPAPRIELMRARPPETPTQRVLARLFTEALRLHDVGLDDSFLDLGGDSVTAAGILWGIQRELGVDLPFRSLLDARTLEDLATLVERSVPVQVNEPTPPPPLSRALSLPLSAAQAQLWLQQRRAPDVPAYNETVVIHPGRYIDESLLRRALVQLIRRHEVLRCVFVDRGGQPHKRLLDDVDVELYALDLRALPAPSRSAAAQSQVSEIACRPFDLAAGPLVRFTLVRFEDYEHRLFVTYHHLILDGMAVRTLTAEIEAEYRALRKGKELLRLPPAVQEPEYCAWQRDALEVRRPALLQYWRERLVDLPELALPTDRPRGSTPSLRGESKVWHLSHALSVRTRSTAAAAGVTRYMLLLAAFVAFLHRHAGGEEVVLGTFTGGRTLPGVDSILGCFVNALVLRVPVDRSEPFCELLSRVREAVTDAYAYQELPFTELVAALKPPRHPGKNPLFQVAFAGDPFASQGATAWRVERANIDRPTSQFDLTIQLVEHDEAISLVVEYSTELFDTSTIARMVRRYLTVLEGALASLQGPVSSRAGARARMQGATVAALPLLPTPERNELMRLSINSEPPPADVTCMHHLFEAQAARAPAAKAVLFEGESLTYAQLDARANQLAHLLRARGVKPGVRVGLCVERSLGLLVALLGILKAGGAYVPLDPAYPPARLAYLVEDAAISVLVAERRTLGVLPEHRAARVLLDQDQALIDAQPVVSPRVDVEPDDLAYVIYTSGSTGLPKGAMVPHRGLCSLAPALIQAFGVRPESRVLQFASICFDASVMEILMALPAGATLVLAPARALLPGPVLRRFIQDHGVTVALLTPAALTALGAGDVAVDTLALPLETVIAGGEACSPQLVASFAPGRRFFNAYGPTEATICATVAECSPEGGRPPVGKPLSSVACLVLDERLEPVPIGVPGELYLGGIGVGRGYLDRPALTASRFVPDPLGRGRLYRTGDRARWRGDGALEILGRVDQQIKLRGFRIEPGEIEAELGAHPAVRVAVVGRVELAPGDAHLIAWVVPRESTSDTLADELKSHLRDRLPAHMIPSSIVLMDQLPVAPGGKVDRAALPVPQALGPQRPTAPVAPSGGIAQIIADIWRAVLRVDVVGLHDNFFDLGGHSLLMGEVHVRLERALNTSIPVTSLFQYPTVGSLAEHLEGPRENNINSSSGRMAQQSHDRAAMARGAMKRVQNQAAIRRMRHG